MVPPFVGVAVKVTLMPEQITPLGFAEMPTIAVSGELTVIVMEFEEAGDPVTQERFDVIILVITSPFARAVEVYVEFVSPEMSVPLFCHWYVGIPPLEGVAVNVTLVPEHITPPGFAAILTLAAADEITDIVMEFEVAGDPVAHTRPDVITQIMVTPSESADDE